MFVKPGAKVAAALEKELGIETRLERGDPGEFTVWVNGEKIAEKGWFDFPSPEDVVKVGQEIPVHLYRAVAEILAYIYRLMNGRAPR